VPAEAGQGQEHSLTAPAEPGSLDQVHALLQTLWSDCTDVGASDRTLFEIAVTEVAGNIVEHAPDGAPLEFTLHVRVHPDRVEAEFRDTGRRVDVDPAAATFPPDMAESGRGLALTLAAVDTLEYRRERSTNHWRLVRRRRAT
jgi:serine/threonine-protein kinase RsbW